MKRTTPSVCRTLAALVAGLALTAPAFAALTPGGPMLPVPAEQFGSIQAPRGSSLPSKPEALAKLREGQAALNQGNLTVAQAAFQASSRIEPTAYAPKLGLADVALRQNRLSDSEALVAEALALAPKSAEVAAVAGRVAFAAGKRKDAERHFRTAIVLDDSFLLPRLDLAEGYLGAGQATRAETEFRAATRVAPDHAGAHYGLGRALAMRGDLAGAAVAFEQAAKVAPKNALALIALAEVQSGQGKMDAALKSLSQAQLRAPGNLQVRLTRASVLARGGAVDRALAEYDDALKVFGPPLSATLHLQKSTLLQAAGKSADADASLRRAIVDDPNSHLAHNNLAWLLAEEKRDLDQALTSAQRALALAPGLAGYEDTLGFVRLARGEADEAVAAFTRASRAAPNVPDFEFRLGTALEAKGQLPQALASYERALAKAAAAPGRPFALLGEAKRRSAVLRAKGVKP